MATATQRWRVGLTASVLVIAAVGVGLTSSSQAAVGEPVPTGTLIAPASGANLPPGQTVTTTAHAVDTPATGYPAGIVTVEFWLYSDKSLGDTNNFVDQYPGNQEQKIFLGETRTPVSGTNVDGNYEITWTVPKSGTMTVTRDGQAPGGLPAPRTYNLPTGSYSIQAHLLNAWWDAHLPGSSGEPGKTPFLPVTMDAGYTATTTPVGACTATQWSAQFYNNLTLSGSPVVTRCDAAINNDWGRGAPAAGVQADRFSVRWTRTATFAAGDYRFDMTGDDGIRIKMDGVNILDGWKDQRSTAYTITKAVTAGSHEVVVEFYDNTYDALAKASYTAVAATMAPSPPPLPTPPPVVTTNLIVNPGLETGTGIPSCFMVAGWGDGKLTPSINSTDRHGGARSYSLTMTGRLQGDFKLMMSEATGCAPAVTPGKAYDLSVWYKSTATNNGLTLFKQDATGAWGYWTDVRTLPAAAVWTNATATTPAVPAGTQRLMFGISVASNGTLLADDYSMIVSGTP